MTYIEALDFVVQHAGKYRDHYLLPKDKVEEASEFNRKFSEAWYAISEIVQILGEVGNEQD